MWRGLQRLLHVGVAVAQVSEPSIFDAGFLFARRLGDPAFRARLRELGVPNSATVVASFSWAPLGEVASMLHSRRGESPLWVVVFDEMSAEAMPSWAHRVGA